MRGKKRILFGILEMVTIVLVTVITTVVARLWLGL